MDERAKKQLLDEVLDPNKVILYCRDHNYFGPLDPAKVFNRGTGSKAIRTSPMQGCPKCWEIYFIHEIGRAAPAERERLLGELERAVANASEFEDAGLFDFIASRHPEITIEKGD